MTRPHLVFILSFLPFYPIYQTTQHLSLSTLFTLSFASPCAILFNLIRYIHGGAIAQLVVTYRVTTKFSYIIICGSLLHVKIFYMKTKSLMVLCPYFLKSMASRKFFIMSTEFDKNISDWRYDCTHCKNGFGLKYGQK